MHRFTTHFRQAALLAACLAGLAFGPAQAQPAPAGSWQFEATPYLFASGLSGRTGVGAVSADVDASFSDILENFDSGFMAAVEARKGPWGLAFDGVYFRLKGQETSAWQGPGGIGSLTGTLEATVTQQIYQFAVAYRTVDTATKVDLIGAARYTQLDTDLNLVATTGGLLPGGARTVSAEASWWDPVIGVRVLAPIAQGWTFMGYADVGGFGAGSDLTFQLMAGANWQFSKALSAKLGYRYFYQDYDKDGFVWDMAAHGPYLGLGIRF